MKKEVAQHIENRLKTSENVRKLVAIENAFKAGGKELVIKLNFFQIIFLK